jgi:uncharacterized protein GlcG (DUF336 family)
MSKRHETVGPHNLGAAEKKAYTALSTKMATMLLSQNAHENKDAKNLTTLSNLLLLGGGVPVRYESQVVGAIGVAGAGAQKMTITALKQLLSLFSILKESIMFKNYCHSQHYC